MSSPAKEALDKITSDLNKGFIGNRWEADELVYDMRTNPVVEFREKVEARLERGEVPSERSKVEGLVYDL